jgi:hypothetical protein
VIDDFFQGLLIDRVNTVDQVRRFYGLNQSDLAQLAAENRVVLETLRIARAANRSVTLPVTFVCINKKFGDRADWMLRHLAAMAEIRYRLCLPRNQWILKAHNPRDGEIFIAAIIPDAIAVLPIGNTAIEYDAGSHGKIVLAQKIAAYEKSEYWINQWWYAATPARAKSILELLENSGIDQRRWYVGLIDWM